MERPPPAKPPAAGEPTTHPAAPPAAGAGADTGGGPRPPQAPQIPAELADHPRYRVERLLGQGGMGAVYLARHTKMDRPVALKVMRPGLVSDPEAVRRFRQEVTAAARLGTHPHIVAVHDADQAGDLHFFVMEHVEGQSLADYLRAKGPLPWPEACDYARQAALGLQHAAEHGMVHRDVKPHNLMRTPEGRIKILDFGLARCGRGDESALTHLTQQGVLMGTADYMAPEQAADARSADVRADLYSLGCMLYHLLTGQVPFPGGTAVDKIVKHAVQTPPPIGGLRPDLPVGVVQIIDKLMAKLPAQRYQSPAEVVEALTPWGAAGPARVVIASPPEPLRAETGPPTAPASAPPHPPGPASPEVERQIRLSARSLLRGGIANGVLALVTEAVGWVIRNNNFWYDWLGRFWYWSSPDPPRLDLASRLDVSMVIRGVSIAWVVLSALTIYGAVQMGRQRSYLWAVYACVLSFITPLLPFTAPGSLHALQCLKKREVREAFARARAGQVVGEPTLTAPR
jgi:serine/threonine protein kinase